MSSLSHHGIKGQRWGVRRFQNKDGTRTAAGKARDYKKARELKQKAYDHYDKYGPAWRNKPVAARMYLKAERLEDPSITPNESSAKANAISAQTVIDAVNLAEAIRSDPKLSDEDRAFYEDTVEQYLHKAAIYSYISDDIRFNFEEKDKPVTDREKDWNDYTSRQKEYLKKRVKDGDTWLHRYEQWISLPTAKHTSIDDSPHLSHHGIKGQRWGVRRFQNKDGTRTSLGKKRERIPKNARIIPKGSRLRRTHILDEDTTFGGRKYLSTNKEDAFEWFKLFGRHYDKISESGYVTTKDLYIAQGKELTHIINNDFSKRERARFEKDVKKESLALWGTEEEKAPIGVDQQSYNASMLMARYGSAYSTKSGEKIVKALKKRGFDGLEDDHGKDVAKDPVIIFDPDKKLDKAWTVNYKITRGKDGFFFNPINHTSIGGTMYIEGNALILGDSSYLEHHGILGQKWGVRRFQNKDGTRTAAGKKREAENSISGADAIKKYKNRKGKTVEEKKEILRAVTKDAIDPYFPGDRKKELYDSADIGLKALQKLEPGILTDADYSPERINDTKDWFLYEDQTDGMGVIANLVDQGYTSKQCKDLLKIIDNNFDLHDYDDALSAGPAEKAVNVGFSLDLGNHYNNRLYEFADLCEKEKRDQQELKELEELEKEEQREIEELGYDPYDYKRNSTAHSDLFIEDGTLYLSHHGIKGQRWGIRRFQNRDGSLTNAGRKRLGYATKGAAQTVSKAFKAGVKAGGNAVKAVKAHHEKKEAEKLQKKKEKASKTRLGVMANKDLFTNEEIRKLNERFKLEDEMKMATLQKGVEIAKAVGTIAQNVGTVAKTYEDVTGQSLSPIKRKAAEEKARQDKEDRERRIAREDADEARKAAKEERDIAIHEQTLRKAIASADTQEFTAQKTKAEADSSILDLYKKGQDFNGGTDATGQSWVEKAKSGGKNPFDDMIANRDPEYAQIRKEHEEKVARKERMAELDRREKERQAEKAAASRQSAPQQKQGSGDDDALFSQKGSLPLDKDRYRNNRAMEKAKQVKEDAAEERAKKQDEKAAKATIDDMMEARRQFTDSARANSNGAFDRETAANYIRGKAKELPSKLNPINAISKKITDKALKEEEAASRKALEDEYKKTSRSQGRDEANYTMYYNRVNALQSQGYSERQAKKVADTENPFSSKRNRRFEYNEKIGEIETTHRKNAKEINKANKELTDYYYKLINGPGYDPGTPKREELDRKYAQKRGELERLEKDNNDMLDREKKKAKKILEHSFSIQNGVLFVDSSDGFAHHGVKGQKWGVRRFQNPDGSLTPKGRKHYEKAIAKIDRMQTHSDARRGRLERQHPFAVTGSAIAGAVAAGLSIAATGGASVAMIAAGSAITGAVSAGLTHVSYSASEAWDGRGTKHRQKKRKEYEEMLNHDGLIVSDGTLYLEHHGVKGQRWGVRRFQNPDGTLTAAGKKRDARQMARELNRLDRRQAKASRESASLTLNRDIHQNRLRKFEYKKTVSDEKGNVHRSEKLQRRIDKGRANIERLNKMIEFADRDYKVSEKKVRSILNTINKSMDYTWKSHSVTRDDWLNNGGFSKDMRSKAGKPKLFEGTYYQWAKGNHYKVAYDNNGKKKRKWEATRGNRQKHIPIHVEYRDS